MDTAEAAEHAHTDMEGRYKWLPELGAGEGEELLVGPHRGFVCD